MLWPPSFTSHTAYRSPESIHTDTNASSTGFIDAARFSANVAGSAIASVSVGNSFWAEAIEDVLSHPIFAVYPAARSLNTNSSLQISLCDELQRGLADRKQYSDGVLNCRLAATSSPVEEVVDEDVSAIARQHSGGLGEGKWDGEFFVVADEVDWGQWGVIVGRVGDGGDRVETCRKSVDVAAEILLWIRVGLLTWEEAREWDEEEVVMED